MIPVFRKELHAFFSSLLGYLALIVFLLVCGFFMWVIPQNSLLDYGFASMDRFFSFAPWVMMFLIPALTMKSFSEEFKSGTIEVLSTLPLSEQQIIAGKFLASLTLMVFSLIPTLLYVYTLNELSLQGGVDSGSVVGAYTGLFFLSSTFTSIGLFCSSITQNSVIAFLASVFANVILYTGFETISQMPVLDNGMDYLVSQIGMQFHYESISRGLLDTRDLIYFLSTTFLFLYATRISLSSRNWQ